MRRIAWMPAALLAGIFLSSCSPQSQATTEIAKKTVPNGSCLSFGDQLRDALVDGLQDHGELPTSAELRTQLIRELSSRGKEPSAAQMRWVDDAIDAYATLAVGVKNDLHLQSPFERLKAITAIALGDHTSKTRSALSERFQSQVSRAQDSAMSAGLGCDVPSAPPATPPNPQTPGAPSSPSQGVNPVLRGAYRTLATAYQSCTAATEAPVDASTPEVEGITVTGTNPENGGFTRVVTQLSKLDQTHYYIRNGIEADSTCFDVRQNPLIYDFGGKPFATTSETSSLDFFKNAGTGSAALGTDCSGFVFSSLAASGLRLSPGKKLKASLVYGVSAAMMMSPAQNGLSCLVPISASTRSPIQSGDILATADHVVILESTSDDPLGLSRAKSSNDCTSAKLSSSGFSLNIIQSAPVKGGLGINRMNGPDYLAENSEMKTALTGLAVSSCKLRFGATPDPLPSSGRVVRHLRTPECLDQEVPLARENCVSRCAPPLAGALPWTSI